MAEVSVKSLNLSSVALSVVLKTLIKSAWLTMARKGSLTMDPKFRIVVLKETCCTLLIPIGLIKVTNKL